MKAVKLRDVKPGEYFTFRPYEFPSINVVCVREDYDRSTRKYGYSRFSDINHYGERKGDTIVYIDFIF